MFFKYHQKRLRFSLAMKFGLAIALLFAPLEAKKCYQVDFKGVESLGQIRSLKDSSNLIRYRKKKLGSMAALQYRANTDLGTFKEVMQAYGFYDACVSNQTSYLPNGKYKITILIDKGARYNLNQFEIDVKDPTEENKKPLKKLHLRQLDIRLGKPALSTDIVDAKEKIVQLFTQKGYPLAKISDQNIQVDQAQKTVDVVYEVDAGPKATFGTIYLEAQSKIKSRFIRNRIQWTYGETYNSNYLKETEKALYDTGLFSLVNITPGEKLRDKDELPITVQLIDSKYNGITIGGSYTTTWEGFGGLANWQTRNLFSSGTDLELSCQINQKSRQAGGKYLFPDFLSKHQTLVLSSYAANNRQPNYTEKSVNTDLYVERELGRHFTTSLGVKFDQLETLRSDNNGYFSLFGIPFHLNTQSSPNVLINPTQGGWANFSFSPYFSMRRNDGNFVELKLEGSVYQYLIPSRRIVLAMNGVFATLFGESNFDIPTPYRFFAGSPNHLRGYPYQEVSPLDANGKPIGGKSMVLWSIEPRFMILKSVAIAGFLDIGSVYYNSWPKWDEAFLKSLGVGVRYFSFVGPLRLDIGFPMNKRPNIKRRYEIYFSFGQPF